MSKLSRMTKSGIVGSILPAFVAIKGDIFAENSLVLKKQIKALKKEVKELKACLNDRENKEKTPAVHCKADLVLIVLLLFHTTCGHPKIPHL